MKKRIEYVLVLTIWLFVSCGDGGDGPITPPEPETPTIPTPDDGGGDNVPDDGGGDNVPDDGGDDIPPVDMNNGFDVGLNGWDDRDTDFGGIVQ